MGSVLSDDKRQQVVALGRLGWSLRRIEDASQVRREAAGAYLKVAGVAVRGRGRPTGNTSRPAISSRLGQGSAAARQNACVIALRQAASPANKACSSDNAWASMVVF